MFAALEVQVDLLVCFQPVNRAQGCRLWSAKCKSTELVPDKVGAEGGAVRAASRRQSCLSLSHLVAQGHVPVRCQAESVLEVDSTAAAVCLALGAAGVVCSIPTLSS